MKNYAVVIVLSLVVAFQAMGKPLSEKKVWKKTNALLAANQNRAAASFMRNNLAYVVDKKQAFHLLLGEQYGKMMLIDSALYFVNMVASSSDSAIMGQAQTQLSKLIPLKDAYKLHMALGKKALLDHELEQATVEFKNALAIDTGNFEAYFYVGRSLQGAGAYDQSLTRYFSALDKYSETKNFKGHVLEHVSENYLLQSKYDSSIIFADSALGIDSSVYDAYLWKGQSAYAIGSFEMGANALTAYVKYEDQNTIAYAVQGNCFYELQRYSSAIIAYSNSLKVDSVQAEVLSYKAKAHAIKKQFQLSYDTFKALSNLHKNNFYAINGMGVCAYFLQDYELALSHYIEANKLYNNMWFKYNLGLCYQALGQYDNAITMYDQVQQMQKWLPEVIVNKTACLLASKQYTKLMTYTDEVIKVGDKFPFIKEIYLARAEAFKAQGNTDKYQKNLRIANYVKGTMNINTNPRIE